MSRKTAQVKWRIPFIILDVHFCLVAQQKTSNLKRNIELLKRTAIICELFWTKFWPQLFKGWMTLSTDDSKALIALIHWILIEPVDCVIHHLNNWDLAPVIQRVNCAIYLRYNSIAFASIYPMDLQAFYDLQAYLTLHGYFWSAL